MLGVRARTVTLAPRLSACTTHSAPVPPVPPTTTMLDCSAGVAAATATEATRGEAAALRARRGLALATRARAARGAEDRAAADMVACECTGSVVGTAPGDP